MPVSLEPSAAFRQRRTTIRRSERDALWHLSAAVLARIDDIHDAFDVGAIDEARMLRRRYDDLMHLGRAEDRPGEEVTRTLDLDRLLRVLLHLHEAGVELVSDHYADGMDRGPKALQAIVIGLTASAPDDVRPGRCDRLAR